MGMQTYSRLVGAGKAKCYHANFGGADVDLVIFKATTEHPEREPQNIFTARLNPDDYVEPADFYCGYVAVNGEVLDGWHISSGHLGEAYDGAFIEYADHKRVNLPDDLAGQLEADGNGDMATEGWSANG
jgi:hypothetical protein